MDCPRCAGFEKEFGEKAANKELKKYQMKGPNRTTRYILDYFDTLGTQDFTVLDIGGGVGVIQHELLKKGMVSHVINVDASSSYQHAVKEEAARRGYQGKIEFFFGDFVTLSDQVPKADIVTLERVICCYSDMNQLVEKSLARATSYYAVVYPIKSWWMEIGWRAINLFMRISGNDFRAYLHQPSELHALIHSYDFHQVFKKRSGVWWVEIFKKETI